MDGGVKPSRLYASEIFDECFPFYLSIGMTAEEYWHGDPSLPRAFRKAYKLKQEQINHDAWLHGLYVYDAVASVVSCFSKNTSSHHQYATEPYSFSATKTEEEKKIEAEAQAEVWMKTWAKATQKMFKDK